MRYAIVTYKITQTYDVVIEYEHGKELDDCIDALNVDDLEIDGIEDELGVSIEMTDIELIAAKPTLCKIVKASEYSDGSRYDPE